MSCGLYPIDMLLRRLEIAMLLGFLAFVLGACVTVQGTQFHAVDQVGSATAPPRQRLTAEGQALLRGHIDAGKLTNLRWPDFAAYQNEVKEFYQSLNNTLAWIQDGRPTPQARALINALNDAAYKGLKTEDYDGSQWSQSLARMQKPNLSESDLVTFDLALTVSAMRYISDLHNGRVNPRTFHFDFDIGHAKFDLSEFLQKEIIGSQNIDAALAAVEPPFPVYHRTEALLKEYLVLAQRDTGALLPAPSKTVKPGASYPAIPLLAKKLALVGDLPEGNSSSLEIYTGRLVDGVKRFQRRHGLEPNGLIDAATIKQLNTPLSRRVMQLQLTLERLRWLPHEFDRPPIVVNIPEFRLHADDEQYHWALSMKVVVGGAYKHQTPVFASTIKSVIFRPYWDVPASILNADLLPHLDKDPTYFAENSYEIVDKNGNVVSEGAADPVIEEKLRSGDLRVRQKPGTQNALGLIKFDVPSPYDVYMHGTPATELFARSRRDFSHGCVRVEDPVALAQWVLKDPTWSEARIRAAMNGDETFQVKLERPIPVLFLYSTAVVMEDGEAHFFDDIYGQDAALEQALAERSALNTSTAKESTGQ
jgi:L,D-transpeptidase YcbB